MFNGQAVTHVDIRLKPGADVPALKKSIASRTNLHVSSWHDHYPAIVAALKLEQYAVTLILGLILFIASMLILHLPLCTLHTESTYRTL